MVGRHAITSWGTPEHGITLPHGPIRSLAARASHSACREAYLIGAHPDPCYTSLMQREDWARLARPFPARALTWHVVEAESEGQRVRVEPMLPGVAIVERLDEVVGREGWSNRYLPLGPAAVICELAIASVTKSAVAGGAGVRFQAVPAAEAALASAAERFGLRPLVDASVAYWVDADPETGQPLHEPEVGASDAHSVTPEDPDAFGAAADELATSSDTPPSARQDGREVIDRLVDRLRAEGLGADAARLVMAFGGYGRDPDEARELYRRLRALLLQKAVPAP